MARLADVFGEAAGFQVGEEALDFAVAIKTIEFFGDVVVDELDLGRSGGFGVINALLQAIEGGAVGTIAESNLRFGGFVESNAAAMASEENFAFGFGFV